ncbi:aldehyde dehydrogenase family protein [Saccharopolyspora sp. NPDC000995]
MREVISGPVVAALPFNVEQGVATCANVSVYGLAAGGVDPGHLHGAPLAMRLKAGSVWINQ